MRRLLLVFPLLTACSGYWQGIYSGRMTVVTHCPSSGELAEEVSGDIEITENEKDSDILNVALRTGVKDAAGTYVSGAQCVGLTASTDSSDATFRSIDCPKSSADEVPRSVTGGTMNIDGNTLKFTLTLKSPNSVSEPTEKCEQTFTGKLDRTRYPTSYYY